MKKCFLLWLFCGICASAFSQKITIIDKSDLQPVSRVVIYNKSKTINTESNNKGVADLTEFNESDTIFFRHITYQLIKTTKKDVILKGGTVQLTDNVITLDEVVFSANKTEEKKKDIPNKIEIISSRNIAFSNPQTAGDVVQQKGSVFVQQSQLGGSSPVLRGFEANKVLLVVDGVRMNNAIYRSGHLQSIITLDPNAIDRAEIIFGPGSVIYGSDAFGGVMHFYTKSPELSQDSAMHIKGDFLARYASASNEKTGAINLNIGLKKIAFFTSLSYKDIGDLRMGGRKNPFQWSSTPDDFGKCFYYTERTGGKDSVFENSDPLIQKRSGYVQYDVLQKVLYKPGDKLKMTLNLQFSNSGNINRYDRLTDKSGGTLKYADWYYGPQTRLLTSLKTEYSDSTKMFDKFISTLAWQNISEDRVQRRLNKNSKEFREETVNVFTANFDFLKRIRKKNELRYGIDEAFNTVGSVAYSENIVTGEKKSDIISRYPDGSNTYNSIAVYASNNWEKDTTFIFSQGLRASLVSLNSSYSDTMMSLSGFPFDKNIRQQNAAVNGHLGLVFMPGKNWRFALMASSGFRAPNVDDVGKVNDSKGSDQQLIIPNPDLKPEYSYNFDLTIGKIIKKKVQFEVTGFYSIISNIMVVRPTTLNGSDSVMYDGFKCQVLSAKNEEKGYVTGCQGNLNIQFNKMLSLVSNLTYTYGRVNDTIPLDHIPPVFGLTTIKCEIKKFKGEFYIRYNGDKLLKDYSPSGEDNLTYAPATGTPAWFTLNLKMAAQASKNIQVQVGLENIMDVRYRYFASGISAPGRNLIFAIRGTF